VRAWGSQSEWAGQMPDGQHQIDHLVPGMGKDMKSQVQLLAAFEIGEF